MWDFVAPVTAIALAVMGIIPALSAFTRRNRFIWIASIVSVTGLSLVASFFSIRSMHADQSQLIDKTTEIISLQTGGDSYPYIMPTFKGDGKVTMFLLNKGKYPLYGVQVTLLDGDFIEQHIRKSDNVSRDIGTIYDQSKRIYKVGDLGQSQSSYLQGFDLDEKTGTRSFTMYLLARNGQVNEWMRLRWVKDHWSVAVIALNERGVLEEQISDDFPQDNDIRDFIKKQKRSSDERITGQK